MDEEQVRVRQVARRIAARVVLVGTMRIKAMVVWASVFKCVQSAAQDFLLYSGPVLGGKPRNPTHTIHLWLLVKLSDDVPHQEEIDDVCNNIRRRERSNCSDEGSTQRRGAGNRGNRNNEIEDVVDELESMRLID